MYYDQNAEDFFLSTIDVDMNTLYKEFLPHVPPQGTILDAGCGSGRDSKFFIEQGFKVRSMDASKTLGEMAAKYIGQDVEITTFQEFISQDSFDAVWACASLLHVPLVELKECFNNLSLNLVNGGAFYCSFKLGTDEVERNGRSFTNLDLERLTQVLPSQLTVHKHWITGDLRPGRETEQWLNALLIKG